MSLPVARIIYRSTAQYRLSPGDVHRPCQQLGTLRPAAALMRDVYNVTIRLGPVQDSHHTRADIV